MYLEIPTFTPRRGNKVGPCVVDGTRADKIIDVGNGDFGYCELRWHRSDGRRMLCRGEAKGFSERRRRPTNSLLTGALVFDAGVQDPHQLYILEARL